MDNHRVIFLVFFMAFSLYLPSCNGYEFFVDGEDFWVIRPSRNVHINDSLYFEYIKSENSVQVTKQAYHHCNTTSPILKKADGFSEFKLGRAGPFYFISGVEAQKLLVNVLPEHHHRRYIAPSPSPYQQPRLSLNEPSNVIGDLYAQDSDYKKSYLFDVAMTWLKWIGGVLIFIITFVFGFNVSRMIFLALVASMIKCHLCVMDYDKL